MPLPGRELPATLPSDIDETVARALAEDIGPGDLTAGRAAIVARQTAVLCGTAWVEAVFRALDPQVRVEWHTGDGSSLAPDQVICDVHGRAHALLTGERTALNFLQTLSGTATAARRYVGAVAGTQARILDTRKTLPGLRAAQKYAVRCGGAVNHRAGLYDGILIKENHIMVFGSIPRAVARTRARSPGALVEVEVENVAELREALEAGADLCLLDNFTLERLHEAVRLNRGRARLEASGNVTLETVRAIAETGVDYISVGAITKDVAAVDLSMRFRN
ncbi:MAG: carboxylating nicotinate-nucleotide diphosphorylase [Gammaproteobacteria bacterium]|nr:carboxylating nicotinate-nucleotide diphosphorylase [Gammaproteobacteria bacterium]